MALPWPPLYNGAIRPAADCAGHRENVNGAHALPVRRTTSDQ